MRKTYNYNEYVSFIDDKRKTIDDMKFYIVVFSLIFVVFWFLTQSLNTSLLTSSILILGYLIRTFLKIVKLNEKIEMFEQQEEIDDEKAEIKKYLNKLRGLLRYLNIEESKIEILTNKYLDLIEDAENLSDFKDITLRLRNDYARYYEVLDEDDRNYTRQSNQKDYSNYYKEHQEKQKEYQYGYQNSTNTGYTYKEKAKSKSDYELKIEKYLLVLELSKEPTDLKELKTIYRKLLKKYHPDNQKQTNLSEKQLEMKAAEINEAYDYFCKILK